MPGQCVCKAERGVAGAPNEPLELEVPGGTTPRGLDRAEMEQIIEQSAAPRGRGWGGVGG